MFTHGKRHSASICGGFFFSAITIKETDPVNVGDTILLEGEVQFHHSLRSIKWQKSLRGNFVDINIHKSKYDGTQNDLKNPKLLIHDVDTDDEVDYRLEVQRSKTTEFSNIHRLITKTLKGESLMRVFSLVSYREFKIETFFIITHLSLYD